MRIFIFLTLLGLSHTFTVTPPENQWAKVGHNLTIQCKSSEPISSCSMTTPYGHSYTLTNGLKTESGRIEFFVEEEENLVCGLFISHVEEKDAGLWECNIGVVNNDSEVSYGQSQGSINFYTKPDSISLDKPYDQGTANVSDDWDGEPVRCIVRNANPKPEFSWFVGDEKLIGYEIVENELEDKQSYSQTLKYSPLARHANQTLRCVVEHVSLEETDEKEAGVILRFTDVSEDHLEEIQKQKDLKEADLDRNFTTIAVAIVLALVFMIFVMIVAFRVKRNMISSPSTEVDIESSSDEKKKPIDEQDSNKKDKEEKDTKETTTDKEGGEETKEEKKVKACLKERFASFLVFNKKQTTAADTNNQTTEKADDEFEKVDLTKDEEGEEEEKTQDEQDTAEAADTAANDTAANGTAANDTAVVTEETEKPSKIRNFFKIFTFANRNQANKDEISMKKKEGETDGEEEKQKKDQVENEKTEEPEEKMKEYEPEEKEKMEIAKEEKKEPKNTDV